MKSALPVALIVAALAAGPAGALAQAVAPPQNTYSSPYQVACSRPAPPVFPGLAAAATLQAQDMEQHRLARDSYFAAADANLSCLDADIEARMRTLFATGGAMDSTLRAQGLAHELASRERAETYEKFVRMCLAYEDTHGPLPGGCR
jgi:hypothetical protein